MDSPRRGHDPIPYEGRVNLVLRRAASHARNARLIAKLSESASGSFTRPMRHTAADAVTLRGIPAVGHGVGGAIAGSRPDGWIEGIEG